MKRLAWWLLGIGVIVVVCVGIHELTSYSANAQLSATITVGSMGSDYEVWQHIAKRKSVIGDFYRFRFTPAMYSLFLDGFAKIFLNIGINLGEFFLTLFSSFDID